jgi:hypothetical protein
MPVLIVWFAFWTGSGRQWEPRVRYEWWGLWFYIKATALSMASYIKCDCMRSIQQLVHVLRLGPTFCSVRQISSAQQVLFFFLTSPFVRHFHCVNLLLWREKVRGMETETDCFSHSPVCEDYRKVIFIARLLRATYWWTEKNVDQGGLSISVVGMKVIR